MLDTAILIRTLKLSKYNIWMGDHKGASGADGMGSNFGSGYRSPSSNQGSSVSV